MRLQTESVRLASSMVGDKQIRGSLEIGYNKGTPVTDAFLKLPSLTTTQRLALTAEVGMQVYDSTLGKQMVYNSGGWSSTDGTAAGSLDAAYNGGAEIAVDSGAVTLTDTQTSTGGGLLITKSGVVTGADSASVFHINSTGAHDTSGDLKFLEISVGAETISGSVYGIEIAMNANSDSALEITKGAVVLADGAMTLTSGALTMTSGNFTMSSGNADITGTLAVSDVSALEEITASGAYTGEGVMILDVDNAEAFLIRENGDAADVLTVDTTQDAGDTTMLLTTKVTTGTGMHIDGSTITSGDVVKITVAAATMTAAGAAISVVADGTEVFAVRDDGSVVSAKGTAEGTAAIDVTTGDLDLEDGDLNVRGGEVSVTDGVTTTGSGISLTSSMTTAGAATGGAGALTIVAASATTGTVLAITADALTSGDMVYLDNGGGTLNGGFYINCNDDNASDFTVGNGGATVITGVAAGTDALTITAGDLKLDDTDGSLMESENGTGTMLTLDNKAGVIASDTAVLLLDAGGAVASGGNILRIAATGTPNAGAIGIEFVGAGKALNAVYIDADPTGADVMTVNGGGALTNDNAVLTVSSDGALATGGNTMRIETGGTPASGAIYCELDFVGLTDTNENIGVKIDAGGKKVVGLHIDADPVAGDVAYMHTDGATADNKAVLSLSSAGTPAAAGSNVLRVAFTGTATNKPTLVEIIGAGKDCQGLNIDADPTTTDVAYIHSDAVIASDKALLNLNSAGAVASGGNVLRVDVAGTPASGAVYAEFDFAGLTDTNENVGVHIDATSKKVQALKIDAAPLAGSTVLVTSTGVLAADKATVELVANVAASNADSSVLRVEQTATDGVSTCMALKQDDVNIPFITFEATVGAGNAIEAVGAKSLTVTHFVMVDIEGTGARYLQVGTIA